MGQQYQAVLAEIFIANERIGKPAPSGSSVSSALGAKLHGVGLCVPLQLDKRGV
jgi:hypothetical protein